MADDLTNIKKKYENESFDSSALKELEDKLTQLTKTLEQSFKKLNTNIVATSLLLGKLVNVNKFQRNIEQTATSVEKVKKKSDELARVITTNQGTYVRLYRTVESYYITQKTLLKQLMNFSDGLDATIIQLRNFNVAAYAIDAFRVRLVKVEAAFHFLSSISKTIADVSEEVLSAGKKITIFDNVGTIIRDFIKGTDGAVKSVNIFGKVIEYNFVGLKNIFGNIAQSADRVNRAFLALIGKGLKTLIHPTNILKNAFNSLRTITTLNKKTFLEMIKAASKFSLTLITSSLKIAAATIITQPLVLLFAALFLVVKKVVDVMLKFNIGGVQTFIIETVAMIKNFFYDTIIYILKVFKTLKFGEELKGLLNDIFKVIETALKAFWPVLKVAIWVVVTAFKILVVTLKPVIKVLEWFFKIIAGINEILFGKLEPAFKTLNDVIDVIIGAFKWLYDGIGKLLKKLGLIKEEEPRTKTELIMKTFEDFVLAVTGQVWKFKDFYRDIKELSGYTKTNQQISQQTKNIQPTFNVNVYTNDKAVQRDIINTFKKLSTTNFGQ